MYLYICMCVCICMSYYSVSCQFAGISITLYRLKLKSFLIVCHECIQLRSISSLFCDSLFISSTNLNTAILEIIFLSLFLLAII